MDDIGYAHSRALPHMIGYVCKGARKPTDETPKLGTTGSKCLFGSARNQTKDLLIGIKGVLTTTPLDRRHDFTTINLILLRLEFCELVFLFEELQIENHL